MSVKKISIIVLVCLLNALIISPTISMAGPAPAPASAGTAGPGATSGLSGMEILVGLAAVGFLLGLIVLAVSDDDDGTLPVHGPSH